MTPSSGTRPSTSTSLQEAFERDGFVVVRGVLDEDTVAVLRLDADRRAHGLHLDADSTVWVHDNQHLALNDVARTQAGPYLALRGDDSPLIARALLTTLPAVVAAATGWVADLRLFNEHYVIKPPGGGQHFLWHRDADRHLQCAQLARGGGGNKEKECGEEASAVEGAFYAGQPPRAAVAYINTWAALDPCAPGNGALALLPASAPGHRSSGAPAARPCHAVRAKLRRAPAAAARRCVLLRELHLSHLAA